jgi:LysR family transcriptional regulator, regulator for metE and metH
MAQGTLDARDLRLVQAVAESGGATAAAKQLHLSQSAVSHQLRSLEERLGIELFRRRGRSLHITAAGRKLVELAHRVLPPLLETELELRRGAGVVRPKLRIATQCYTAYHWLPQAFMALAAEHPEVELTLTSEVLGDPSGALSGDQLDLALCFAPPKQRGFESLSLFEDELMLAVPRGHALSRKPYVTGGHLAGETLIGAAVSPVERERVQKALFGKAPPVFARVVRLPVAEAALDLVQAGLGVSIVTSFAAGPRVARGDLELVRLTRRGMRRSWTGVFPKGSPLSAPIRSLLDTLRRQGLPGTAGPRRGRHRAP